VTLAELVSQLAQHGISLMVNASGNLNAAAGTPPPAEVIEGIKRHRAVLILRLTRGQMPDGNYPPTYRPGCCGTCIRWIAQRSEGLYAGACALDWSAHHPDERNIRRPVITHGHGPCAALNGTGWAA